MFKVGQNNSLVCLVWCFLSISFQLTAKKRIYLLFRNAFAKKSAEKYLWKVEVGQMSDNLTLFSQRFQEGAS